MQDPEQIYKHRQMKYGVLLHKQQKTLKFMGNCRLLIFVGGITVASLLYFSNYQIPGVVVLLASLAGFIYLVGRYERMKQRCAYTQALIGCNEKALQRVQGEWTGFADDGKEFIAADHAFAPDLDVCGQGSLFQWINVCQTQIGRQKLAQVLLAPLDDIAEINQRQQAVAELTGKLTWRQRFAAEGLLTPDKIDAHNAGELSEWARSYQELYCQGWLRLLTIVLPLLTSGSLILAYGFNLINGVIPLALLLCQIGLLFWHKKERSLSLELVYGCRANIRVYRNMLQQLERQRFSAATLKKLQAELQNYQKISAWEQIDRLDKLTDFIANRYNLFYIIVNVLFLWDYQAMIRLEKWKRSSGRLLPKWLAALGELEMLSSLAVIGYDNKGWVLPEIVADEDVFQARQIGHPLITRERVCNDVTFAAGTRVLLITGSNMSGKSTLLRTAGINLLLAYIGAPVCAEWLRCSLMELHSSMRTSDNLEKNYSSFYAELLRIKAIVEAVNTGHKVFFLLDEIFKGTNSYDRHIGAKVLIKQLLSSGAMGMVSTHDLELADLEEDSQGKVRNFHFCEYYKDNQIFFDYKLKEGVSKTRNALSLIRMIGINV